MGPFVGRDREERKMERREEKKREEKREFNGGIQEMEEERKNRKLQF